MRTPSIPAVLVLLMAFAAGCTDQPVPTGLSDSPDAAVAVGEATGVAVPLFSAAAAYRLMRPTAFTSSSSSTPTG